MRRMIVVAIATALVVAACAPAPTEEAGPEAVTTTTAAATTTTTLQEAEEEPAPPPEAGIEREVWKYLGEVISGDEFGTIPGVAWGLADPKVGRFGDGTYILVVHAAGSAEHGTVVYLSDDLLNWEFVHEIGLGDAWFNQGFHGGFITLDDGSVRMYWVEGGGVASGTTADGVNWTRDPGFRLTNDDLGPDALSESLTIVPRAEGGWRMYIELLDCQISNLYGDPNCEVYDPDLAIFDIASAVSNDMLEWTVEPGIRFRQSWEDGAMHQPHAWIDADGRVRLSGTMGPAPLFEEDEAPTEVLDTSLGVEDGHPGWSSLIRVAFGTLISDDGLDFHTYEEQGVVAADSYVVRADDGRFLMFTSPGQAPDVNMGVHLWELTTVSWDFDHVSIADVEYDWDAGGHSTVCFRIEVYGEGHFTIGVYDWTNTLTPYPTDPRLYEIDQPVFDAPATVFIKAREWLEEGEEPAAENEFPNVALVTDQDGVTWWLSLYPHAARVPGGDGCGF